MRLAGYRLDGAAGLEDAGLNSSWALQQDPWSENDNDASESAERQVTMRQLLRDTAFHLVSNENDAVPSPGLTAWGRVAVSRFNGQSDDVSTHGQVSTAMLGVDSVWNHWVTGVALAHSEGDGSYGAAALPEGDIDSRLTSVHPYVAYLLNRNAWVWGMGGFGEGALSLTQQRVDALRTDIDLTMAAVGARSALLAATQGLNLAVETDGFWVRTTSDAVPGLVAADATVSRARLSLEGTYVMILHSGSALTPMLEIGLRHDAGDAETGWGMEVGGGFAWSAAVPGLAVELEARSLVGHHESSFRDWSLSGLLRYDPNPLSGLGLSASLRSSLGTDTWNGAEALLRSYTPAQFTARGEGGNGEVAAEAAYGFAILGGRFTGAPWIGAAVLEHRHDYRLGYRISPARHSGSAVSIDIAGVRRKYANAQAEQAIRMRLEMPW